MGFDAQIVVSLPLPPELIEVEPREAPADIHTETAALPAKEPSRNRTVVVVAVLLVLAAEIGWLIALGYGIVRTVSL